MKPGKFLGIDHQDWTSSTVVFLVSLPLSLGIALASGVSPAAALLSAIIGGIAVAWCSGAPLTVTGPAAGLVTLVFHIIQQWGFRGLMVATVIAGVVQLAMAFLKLGRWFAALPEALLDGMLGGIGLVIALGQLHIFLGSTTPPSSPLMALTGLPRATPALLCGLIALAIQLSWSRLVPRYSWIPGALPAVLLATPLSLFFSIPRVTLEPVGVHLQNSILGWLSPGVWNSWISLLVPGITLALVASSESLLTGRAVFSLIRYRDGSPPDFGIDLNRELRAQGMGNLVCGVLGGLPMSSVITRGAVNVRAGAKSWRSAMLQGLWMALFVSAFPNLLRLIPLSALASILVVAGVRLLNLGGLRRAWNKNWRDGAIWTVTLIAVPTTSLLTGLVLGVLTWAITHFFSHDSQALS